MKNRFFAVDMLLILLCAACVTLSVALAVANPLYFVPVVVVLLILAVVMFLSIRRLRVFLQKMFNISSSSGETHFSLAQMTVPVVTLSGKKIIWYNDAFLHDVLNEQDINLVNISKVLPGFDIAKISEPQGQDIFVGEKRFSVYGAGGNDEGGLFVAYLIDNTVLKAEASEYKASRPCIMQIVIDTYDELLKELKESERARIISEIDVAFERFAAKTGGCFCRTSASRYIAIIEQRYLDEILNAKFDLLDTVRAIGSENAAVTLSIGTGYGGKTLQNCDEMARQALDMALGRGGDQAAVRSPEGFEFYGGVSRSVEKRSKVKSRIVAAALKDLIQQSDSVLIMGHKNSDLDSVGAAMGMLRFCKVCEKPAAVVINQKQSLAANMIKVMCEAGYADDFITPEEVIDNITPKTLLVVVDTHLVHILESKQVYDKCKNIVVIDHHRKCMGYIENAVVFYHEPYASSASELVSELLQYLGDKDDKPNAAEALALLAGIMLDTRGFSLHTGVRTFEAAAYLRRMGAQTQDAKKMFSSTFDAYAFKAELVTQAEIYKGCAVVMKDELPEDMTVVVPQAANDLLTIDGVEASFVAVDTGDQIAISARSMGVVNVQVIMEKLGGGGHFTMAGAQLKNCRLEQAKEMIFNAIDEYRKPVKKDK